jgi:hypothetical protein
VLQIKIREMRIGVTPLLGVLKNVDKPGELW